MSSVSDYYQSTIQYRKADKLSQGRMTIDSMNVFETKTKKHSGRYD
jgi:hypothetical protein